LQELTPANIFGNQIETVFILEVLENLEDTGVIHGTEDFYLVEKSFDVFDLGQVQFVEDLNRSDGACD
jgi:hypothetical protein